MTVLIDVLAAQQPTSRYPFQWPLPFPAESFIVRDHELAAWVAEVDGEVVGHIAVQSVASATGDDGIEGTQMRDAWVEGLGRPADQLAMVSGLFTSTTTRGRGVGLALLDTAVDWIHGHGLGACLDVLPKYSDAAQFYERRGWVRVALVRPPWLPEDEESVIAMVLPDHSGT